MMQYILVTFLNNGIIVIKIWNIILDIWIEPFLSIHSIPFILILKHLFLIINLILLISNPVFFILWIIRVWRNNHNQELVKRAEESRTKTEEQRKKAQKELEEFYQKRNEQIQNKHKENSESQKDVVNKREEVEKLGNKWERVRHLIDVKGTEKSTDAKDTSRLRSVLIKMWNKK